LDEPNTRGAAVSGALQQCRDGSTLEIRQVTFAKDFNTRIQSGNRLSGNEIRAGPGPAAIFKNRSCRCPAAA